MGAEHLMSMQLDSNKTFLAFLDVLGFSTLVENNDHATLQNIYQTFINTVIISATHGKTYIAPGDGNRAAFAPQATDSKISFMIVSDSIIIWSKESTALQFVNLIKTVRLLLHNSIFFGLPLRGSITVGPLSLLSSSASGADETVWSVQSIFGKALVQAYQLEEKQDWSGCILHPDAQAYYESKAALSDTSDDLPSLNKLEQDQILIKYPVPMRKGDPLPAYALKWPSATSGPPGENGLRDSFASHRKDLVKAESKLKNTIAFAEHCKNS